MKRGLRILLSGIALFSLVSCVDDSERADNRPTYKVTFLNYDDTFLYETIVFEGKPAYYSGELPKRELEGVEEGTESDFEYKFTGWDQDLTAVYSNITTRATFEYGPKEDWGPMTRF